MLYALAVERLLEEHHRGSGPAASQGDVCAQVMSQVFHQRHRELVEDISGAYSALSLQVHGRRGLALVRFSATHELREVQIWLHREGGGWSMAMQLDSGAQ
jgi:hypothetical protein